MFALGSFGSVMVVESWPRASQPAESYWGKRLQIARHLIMVG